jgi:hypothetical protein
MGFWTALWIGVGAAAWGWTGADASPPDCGLSGSMTERRFLMVPRKPSLFLGFDWGSSRTGADVGGGTADCDPSGIESRGVLVCAGGAVDSTVWLCVALCVGAGLAFAWTGPPAPVGTGGRPKLDESRRESAGGGALVGANVFDDFAFFSAFLLSLSSLSLRLASSFSFAAASRCCCLLIAACLALSAFSRDKRVASAFSAALASFFISFLDFFGLSVGWATAAGIGGIGTELGGGERVSTTDRLRGLGLIGKVEGGCRAGTSVSSRACGTTLGEVIGDADGDDAGEAPAGRGAI